jgi:hypothetical protein
VSVWWVVASEASSYEGSQRMGKLEPSLNRQYSGVHEKSVNVVNL